MNREEYRTGLWKKTSKKGNTYCSGKFKLDGKEYFLTLFNNDKKGNEKAPDFQLFIRDSINAQEEQKSVEITPKIEPSKDVYAEFWDMVANDDDVIPF